MFNLDKLLIDIKVKMTKVDVKKYDNIIFLGYNCETAYQFYRYYKFVNSSLFAWTNAVDINKALSQLERIGTEDFEYVPEFKMFKDNVSSICFHGKTSISDDFTEEELKEVIKKDYTDLVERTAYLKEKFKKQMADGGKNLFIRKIRMKELCEDPQKENLELEKLYEYINTNCKNKFDLLLIVEEKYKNLITIQKENLHIRAVRNFNSDACVMGDRNRDRYGWGMIFHEFRPMKKTKKRKKFKFE
ncbi:MAG: hypothetical protein MJ229_00230 [bacterium]|nr:hypothetical protein [bacterium]